MSDGSGDAIVFVSVVMAGLDPAIHLLAAHKDVDARPKAGHDGEKL
jgi:hypothetical protein